MSNNVGNAGNQQATFVLRGAPETIRGAPLREALEAYLQGALHDGTFSSNNRFRFSQKGTEWLLTLKRCLAELGFTSWIYREGKDRDVYVLETLADFLDFKFNPGNLRNESSKVAYIRGFFDAEGGIPHDQKDRFYIQLVQKNRRKLELLKKLLVELQIKTGIIHNPSKKVDPDYWRMYVLASSWQEFLKQVNSWHPVKKAILSQRMKI